MVGSTAFEPMMPPSSRSGRSPLQYRGALVALGVADALGDAIALEFGKGREHREHRLGEAAARPSMAKVDAGSVLPLGQSTCSRSTSAI